MNVTIRFGHITLDVEVTKDFEVKGTYDPFEVSDWDFYGYRDTEWKAVSASYYSPRGSIPCDQREIDYLVENLSERLTELVQKEIDRLK